MLPTHLMSFPPQNRKLLKALVGISLGWSLLALLLFWGGRYFPPSPYLDALWMAIQLFTAAQLLIPVQFLKPEPRQRLFYWFWLLILIIVNALLYFIFPVAATIPAVNAVKSGVLLLSGTLVGAVLARYIDRLRDALLVCVAMSVADFSSWLVGPTAQFSQQIAAYYQTPEGPAPMIDMVLIKLAFPGGGALMPVVGVSDWVMVTFFTCVASQFQVKENLFGGAVRLQLSADSLWGRYLPVPVVVLFAILLLAQSSHLFIPVLPLLAVAMIGWYLVNNL